MAGNPIIESVARLFAVLDELGIRYFAGGSVASSVHGVARFTQAVDLAADLKPEQTEVLAARLNSAFYADAGQMREGIEYGRAFHVIHFASGFKIDIFPLRQDSFHRGELERSARRVWAVEPGSQVELQVASAEDIVLEKLVWYERGGQTSDRQWNDVLGVATTHALDLKYTREWALELGVADLVERLLVEASQISPD
jgi:hypothetical protein